MVNQEIFQKAISTYGVNAQLDMAIEEMSELIKEICKNKRGKENHTEILEEIADVSIMMEQLKIIFCISDKDVEKISIKKINRLKKYIKTEKEA